MAEQARFDVCSDRTGRAEIVWRTEAYHRRYSEKNGLPSCHVQPAEEQ